MATSYNCSIAELYSDLLYYLYHRNYSAGTDCTFTSLICHFLYFSLCVLNNLCIEFFSVLYIRWNCIRGYKYRACDIGPDASF